jgi:hypothetical protein
METLKKLRIFNGNTLKILAAVFMFVDHLGLLFFPSTMWLRDIGRLSMPLFAFMIAEGCRYTRNKLKHFLLLFGLGTACQIVYIIFDPSNMYLGILLTFSVSTLIIYAMQYAKKCFYPMKQEDSFGREDSNAHIPASPSEGLALKAASIMLVFTLIVLAFTLCHFVTVDYGFWGIMMPVFASIFDFHQIPAPDKLKKMDCLPIKILCMAIAEIMLIVTHFSPRFQVFSLLAFLLLLLYNGEKGKANLKYFFYIFYPVHLGLLTGISMLLFML